MADELVIIEGTLGPYAFQRINVDAAEATQAIADGWAIDPFGPPPEPKELTPDERFAIIQTAEAAARRLRGQEEVKAEEVKAEEVKAKPAAHSEPRTVEAAKPDDDYQSRNKAKK
jgi:hypothetical protein